LKLDHRGSIYSYKHTSLCSSLNGHFVENILGQVLGVQQCVITSARHNKWCVNNAL